MITQHAHLDTDKLQAMLLTETQRYEAAINKDTPFRQVRRIRKNIARLKALLTQQELNNPHTRSN